jgi:hypothetical protein
MNQRKSMLRTKEYPGQLTLALGIVLFFTVVAAAAGAADLAGTVTEEGTGVPLASVVVRMVAPLELPDGAASKVVTATDGAFLWRDLPGGVYELEFSADGLETRTMKVTLGLEDVRDLKMSLPQAAYVLEDLVVSGTTDIEQDLQTGYVKLDQETLAEIPGIIEDDPLRALQILPGVQAASDISSGLYIRGGGPDQTLVLMDGVTVYNPTHAFGFFSTFNNDAVRDLTLYKGAYPAAYGGRLGGLLNVNMVQETAPNFGGKVGLSLISGRLFLEGRLGRDHWWVSGRRSFLEPLLSAIRTAEDPIPEWYFYDMNAGYTSYRGGGVTRLTFYHGRDKVNVDADVNTFLELGWGNTVAMLRHERFLGENIEGRVTLSHSRYESRTDAEILATEFDVINLLKDTTLSGQLDWQAAESHRVLGGIAYSWFDFDYREEFNRSPSLNYGSRPNELAVFGEDRWFVDDQSTVRGGLRYRYLSEGSRSLWEPRLSANRQVSPDLRL